MNPNDFARAKSLFVEALELAGADREAMLDDACAGNIPLRDYVDSLLANDALPDGELPPLTDLAGDAGQDAWLGRELGAFKLCERIGQGGMGDVYRATRTADFSSEVAIKFARHAQLSGDLARRFQAEIRFQASLSQHPNIAAIREAGQTDEGVPYFVMDYVDGVRIDEYCDQNRLEARQRIELFQQVCQAVQFAHQNTVIHRDLKPSNVLVTSQGIPMLIDFGIAKLISGEGELEATMTGGAAFTPAYASPEQVQREPLTTATDIYSLGVLLYEILTGHKAYPPNIGLPELVRKIIDETPTRPSDVIARSETVQVGEGDTQTVTPEAVCARRRTTMPRLQRFLRGDLDTIVLTAMHKEPARRYATTEQLSDDLRRSLAGLPIRAVPDHWSYRASKFIQRNRMAVCTVGLLLLSLVVGTVGTTAGMLWALQEGQRARSAEIAERERVAELEQVTAFQAEQLANIDPTTMGIGLRETLVERAPEGGRDQLRGALSQINFTNVALETLEVNIFRNTLDAIEQQFENQPLVRAQLLQSVANVLRELGLFDVARDPQRLALATRQAALGETHPHTLRSLNNHAVLVDALGQTAEAEEIYRDTIAKLRAVVGDEHADTREAISNLGDLLRVQGRHDEAERFLSEALETGLRVDGPQHHATLRILNSMGLLRQSQGRYADAESYHRQTLDARRQVLGEDHPKTLVSIHNLGAVLRAQGRVTDAEEFYRQAMEGRRRVLGDKHPYTVVSISNLGDLLRSQQRFDEAEPLIREALAGFHRLFGKAHGNTLAATANFGAMLQTQNRFAEARQLYEESYDACFEQLGEEHAETIRALGRIGWLLKAQGQLQEAESILRQVLKSFRRLLGDDHPRTYDAMYSLSVLLLELDELDEAESLAAEALAMARSTWSEDHWGIGVYQLHLAATLVAQGEFADAEQQALAAHTLLAASFKPEHWRMRDAVKQIARLYDSWHESKPGQGYDTQSQVWQDKLPDSETQDDDQRTS